MIASRVSVKPILVKNNCHHLLLNNLVLQSFLPGITAGNSQVTCQSHLQPPSKGNLEKKNSSSFLSPQDHVLLTPSRAAMTGIGNFSQAPIISLPRATKGPTYQNCLDFPKKKHYPVSMCNFSFLSFSQPTSSGVIWALSFKSAPAQKAPFA